MKRILTSSLIVLLLLMLASWFFFFRNSDSPVAETIRDVLPFGSGEDINIPLGQPTEEVLEQMIGEDGAPKTDLFPISETPVAGAVAFVKNGSLVARYVDRATGHIYDADLQTLEKTKIVNNTIPKVYEAHFRTDGSQVLLRYLKDDSDLIENLSLTLTPPRGTSTSELYNVSAVVLRGDITDVTVGASSTLFYVLRDSASITTSNFSGVGIRNLFTSIFRDWNLTSAGSRLVATTRPHSTSPGYAYVVNTATGSLNKILGPLSGLSSKPDSQGAFVLYSYNDQGNTKLSARSAATGSSYEIYPSTLSDKCTWSRAKRGIAICGVPTSGLSSSEPESWHKGQTHYADRIWMFEVETGVTNIASDPKEEFGLDIDAYNLQLSPNEEYLLFQNKNDLSLWALKLPEF